MFGIIFRFFAYSARGRTVCLILGAHPSKMAVSLPDLKCCALPDVRRRSRSPRRSKLALPELRIALPSLRSSLELPLLPSNSWLCDSLWKPAWSFNYNYQTIGNRHISQKKCIYIYIYTDTKRKHVYIYIYLKKNIYIYIYNVIYMQTCNFVWVYACRLESCTCLNIRCPEPAWQWV